MTVTITPPASAGNAPGMPESAVSERLQFEQAAGLKAFGPAGDNTRVPEQTMAARAAHLISLLPQDEAERIVARIEAKVAAKRRPLWRRALDRLTGRCAVTSAPAAAVSIPLDPSADASLFALVAEWRRLESVADVTDNTDESLALSELISDLQDQINLTPARTVPGLRFKLLFAWARLNEDYDLETALVYGKEPPALEWHPDSGIGKWARPERDPVWALVKSLSALLGVTVAPDLADDLLVDPVVALHVRWKKAHSAYLDARDRLDSTTTGRDDLEREAHRLLGEEGAIVEAMLKVQPTTPAGIACLIEVGMRNAPIDTGFEDDWPWPFFAAAQKAAESMKVGEAVHA